MRIRQDSVFVSSVLFSISLLALVPQSLRYAATWRHHFISETPRLWVQNYFAPVGFSSLAFVLVGLIVIWSGYIKRSRWSWFVMAVIVSVFAFPVYMLPVIQEMHGAESINWSAWFWDSIRGSGVAREYAKAPLDFMLMVIALLLPLRSFFLTRPNVQKGGESAEGQS